MINPPKINPSNNHPFAYIDELEMLIEMAYQLFVNYRPHRPLQVCTNCCMCEKNVELIYGTPVHKLSRAVIFDYLDSAQFGTDEALSSEIRYFAPRILELLAKGEHIRHSLELALDKFHLQAGVWSKTEVALLERFSVLFLQQVFNKTTDHFCYVSIFEYVVMFYLAGLNNSQELLAIIGDYLDNDNFLLNLCAEVYHWYRYDEYYNSFANPELNVLISNWYKEPAHRRRLVDRLLDFTQSDMYQTLDETKRYWVDCTFDKLA